LSSEPWIEEHDELPGRPRRRLLAPAPLALLGVLLIAGGFIAGVLVEKGQTSSSSSAGGGGVSGSGLASRLAALRGGSGAGTGGAAGGRGAREGGGFFGPSSGSPAGAGSAGATAGQVAYIDGSTLYVTTVEGNTVKVLTSPASAVTKTVKTNIKSIHPGETVLVTGSPGANGAVSAESIRVGIGGGGIGGGGLAALFGGGGGARGGGGNSGAGGGGGGAGDRSTGGGETTLFGKG
jgi:hypothetical protein